MLAVLAVAAWCMTAGAANRRTSVTQVSTTVVLDTDVDYIITGNTPFGEEGVVNITNTEHAVLIVNKLKPSAMLNQLSHVLINGQPARQNNNCQVKIYNRGCIILPYGPNVSPLTVYSEPNYEGESANNFGLGNTNGFMNTLTDAQLNNRIRSFKLKRGYMVTFSTLPNGRGYSRCFIADKADLEVNELPVVLDNHISSYRCFKWYDTGKQQVAASGGDNSLCSALNVTSTYTWGTANEMFPDFENVPHHIYENYPSPSALGSCTSSPHMKTNNEPMNTADDPKGITEDIPLILSNWEDLMATGMRLCSPSSWDGSDYTSGTGWLKNFIDSIDARGWRCDIIDLHCYWPESNFSSIKNWTNTTGRPVWISEWVWGASWNSNGAFASGVTEAQNAAAVQRICQTMNSNDCIERYYYWNSERDPSRLYKNGKLTAAGEYYASINSGLGYNGKYNYIPKTPKQYVATSFKVTTDGTTSTITWYDHNGEYNQLMEIQRRSIGGSWETLAVIEQQETAASYSYTDDRSVEGDDYRIHILDLNGVDRYTNEDHSTGEGVLVGQEMMYMGGNVLTNGGFDLGFQGWTTGKGKELSSPWFEVVKTGGASGTSYLHSFQNVTLNTDGSIKTVVPIEANTNYFFSMNSMNGGKYQYLSLTADGSAETQNVAKFNATDEWRQQTVTFNSDTYEKLLIAYRWIPNARFDNMELRPLFATQEEAYADGVAKARLKAEAVKAYNTIMPQLNEELTEKLASITGTDLQALTAAELAVNNAINALHDKPALDSLLLVVNAVEGMNLNEFHQLDGIVEAARTASTATAIIDSRQQLQTALDEFLSFTEASVQPKSPSFANSSSTGWTTKCGTHTGGDQKIYTKGGKTCWNAWWSGINASEGANKTMEIKQTVTGLPQGIYALRCKGATEHYCVSDQHGYLTYGDQTAETQVLSYDFMDMDVDKYWQTLTTTPIYVEENGEVTIGFKGSKQGATDNAWHRTSDFNESDKREGWWCATDFELLYHPTFRINTKAGKWGTICLQYTAEIPESMKLYTIAGVLSDQSAFAITPATTLTAGVPYIYHVEEEGITLFETGTPVTTASRGDNGLRGLFKSTQNVPVGGFILNENGSWTIVKDASNRPRAQWFSAFIRKIEDATVLDSWDGLTMPIGIIGDVNGDGNVNSADVQKIYALMANGATGETNPEADLNKDGYVNSADIQKVYAIMASN